MRKILSLFRRRGMERQLDAELRFHMECKVRDYVTAGMTENAARARARLDFGALEDIKDECRDQRPLAWAGDLRRDLAYAVRGIRLNPGFTAVAVLTLALAIGANTAIFSVVSGVLLRELPYRDADRLAVLWTASLRQPAAEDRTSIPNFEDWRAQSRTFEDMAFYTPPDHATVSDARPGGADSEMVWFTWVSPNFIPLLGAPPVLGRGFSVEETARGESVAVVSHRLWQRRFAGSPDVLGRIVDMNGSHFQVIGVMPAPFEFPARDVDIWLPISAHGRWQAMRANRQSGSAAVIGRLRKGSGIREAQAEMSAIASRMERQYPEANAGKTIRAVPLEVMVFGKNVPFMLMVLLSAVAFVLLIACANVANLLLARGRAREREIAVRTALGAGRARLIRQMLTESVVLAGLAGALGLGLAIWGAGAIRRLGLEDVPRIQEIGIDARVLAFTIAISVLAGLLFGIAPALKMSRTQPNQALTVHGSTSAARRRSRGMLVVVEFALAVILLTGAGLLIRSFAAVLAVDPGFRPKGVLTMRFTLRNPSLYPEVMDRLRSLPGVEAVGAINGVMSLGGSMDPDKAVLWTVTAGDAFRVLGIPLMAGRFFSEHDARPESPPAAIVNETFARRMFPGVDPIGQRYPNPLRGDPPLTVVGVVKDLRNTGLEQRPVAQIFPAPRPRSKFPAEVVVRTASDPKQLAAAIREAVRGVDKGAVVWNVTTLEQRIEAQLSQRRFQSWLLGLFAALALVLAAIGVYGLLHYSVAQRTREIGIRMALGARPGEVRRMVIREGLALALGGVILGLAGALALTRTIATLLFGVTPTDPATFTAAGLILTAIALLACFVPAYRATRLDPLAALRCE